MRAPLPPELVGPPPGPESVVTVIVDTYNQEDFIETSLGAVLGQQMSNGRFHVVVHDDASTDSTPQILRRVAAENPDRVHLVLQRENTYTLGLSPAADYLTDLPTTYVAWCEGDDVWTSPHKLERQVAFMQAHPWCTISHHAVEISVEGGSAEYAAELQDYLDRNQPRSPRTPGVALTEGNFIMTCSVMMRSSVLRYDFLAAIGATQPEDWLYFMLAAEDGDIGFLPEVMSRYRLHGTNMWSSFTPAERSERELGALWFLATHLRGPLQRASQERLLEILLHQRDGSALAPLQRLQHDIRALEADREHLQQRLHTTESTLAVIISQIQAGQSLTESLLHDLRAFRNARP